MTLQQQFKFKKPPVKLMSGGVYNECVIGNLFLMVRVIRFIIKNNCKLEKRHNTESDVWGPASLREFLRFATGEQYKEDPDWTPFQDYLTFWRIKTTATPEELQKLVTAEKDEE